MRFRLTIPETYLQLYGAWRTFWLDKRGIMLFGNTPEALLQSFWCGVVLLPAYVLLLALQPGYSALMDHNSTGRLVSVETITYVMGWIAWPVVAQPITAFLERRDQYFNYICAYNWVSAPMLALFLLLSVIETLLPLPEIVTIGLTIGAIFWRLFLHSFVIRNTLQITGMASIPLIIFDFILGQMILVWRHGLLLTAAM